MKKLLALFIFTFFPLLIFSQDVRVEKVPGDLSNPSYRWGNDIVVLDKEPIGGFYGVQKSNGTIYAAINDTLSTPNLGIVIRVSTDKGNTWQMHSAGITLRETVNNLKLIRSGLDSIYCFFHHGTNVYSWNIAQPFVNTVLSGNYRAYDIAASSTGNLYIVVDSLSNNSILRYGSTDGGSTWISRGNITTAGSFPTFNMSTSGDTLVLNYYGTPQPDTLTSSIRNARYRESGPGTMAVTGSFTDLVPAGEAKHEFKTAFRNGEIFFAFSKGPIGGRDIYYRKSLDNGLSFSTEAPIVNSPTRDEFWFDVKSYFVNTGGFDFTYFSDSTSPADQLFFTGNEFGSTAVNVPGTQVNQFPMDWSVKDFAPKIVELYYSADDRGLLYVASTVTGKKLVWDYLTNVIPVEFTSFTGSAVNGTVMLNWSTATETNNKGFEVQRSTGTTWEGIGFVEGNGTTLETKSYTFSDNTQLKGSYSYRLKQIDLDGSFNYSVTITVDAAVPDEFALYQNYPNPFNPVTKIKYQVPGNSGNITTLKVYDMIGNEVSVLVNDLKPTGVYEAEFNASGLASGMYFYELKSGNFSAVKKMVVLK